MPNWCKNYIEISGSKENMKPLVDYFSNPQTDIMQSLVEFDRDDINEEKRSVLSDFSSFYGTKWDFDVENRDIVEVQNEQIFFSCETAWSPPNEFLRRLCEKYKVNASNIYSEIGCDFAGKYECNSEGEESDECYKYMQGIYITDKDLFWMEVDSMDFDWIESIDELKQEYTFLTEDEMKELIDIYKQKTETI